MESAKPKSKKTKAFKVLASVFLVLLLAVGVWFNRQFHLYVIGVLEMKEVIVISEMLCEYVQKHEGVLPSSWADLEKEGLCRKGDLPYTMHIIDYEIDIRKYKIAFGYGPEDFYYPPPPKKRLQINSMEDHKPLLLISTFVKRFRALRACEEETFKVAFHMIKYSDSPDRVNSAGEDRLAPK